ncbi:MAG: helix-turn-helix transcriptional regulator [Chloroflexi bacterium]|nr:helix-turn-helix transcriptional regulator [Chloroflexota bacterium]
MTKSIAESPRGILNPKAGEKKFQLSRPMPSEELRFFVEHYWRIQWDLRGQAPYRQETLPHPCVNWVFEHANSRIYGVVKGKFARLLSGKGQVFSIKFKPGAFFPFVQTPIDRFTDRSIRCEEIFGPASQALEAALLALDDEAAMVEMVENFLRERLPAEDEQVVMVNQIIDQIIADRTIIKVDELVRQCNLHKRTLQRLFSQYVGMSPKWVIKIYRLQEAAEQLTDGAAPAWAQMALELGYFDQAHFIKDFKAIIGLSPTEYVSSSS